MHTQTNQNANTRYAVRKPAASLSFTIKWQFMKKQTLLVLIAAIVTGTAAYSQPSAVSRVPAVTTSAAVNIPSNYLSGTLVNYIRTYIPQKPVSSASTVTSSTNVADVNRTTQYIDGLGRPLQVVNWQNSPAQKDIVAPLLYDDYGRETYKYLPYTSSETNGSFKLNPFISQNNFYTTDYKSEQKAVAGETFFYSKNIFEASPLNRIDKSFAQGNSWIGTEGTGSEKAVKMEYLLNNSSDNVTIWTIGNNTDFDSNTPSAGSYYSAGELYKTITKDEHGNAVAEYKDKEDHVVLKKVQVGSVSSDYSGFTNWLSTYYVYDDFDNLRFVIPPKATSYFLANGSLSTTVIDELCFRYEYDGRNRMTGKKVPGAGWVYMIYDKRNRLVFTQDANLRSQPYWMYTLYDELNRPVQTGIMSGYSGTRSDLQAYVDGLSGSNSTSSVGGTTATTVPDALYINEREAGREVYQAITKIEFGDGFESALGDHFETLLQGGPAGFSSSQTVNNSPFPSTVTKTPLILTYYDNYDWETAKTFTSTYNSQLNMSGDEYVPLPSSKRSNVNGLVTGARVKILKGTDAGTLASAPWLGNVNFYDNDARLVQVQSDNHKGGNDLTVTRYMFNGNIAGTYSVHNNPIVNTSNLGVKTVMVYDHAGRLLNIKKKVGSDAERYIIRNTYDALGQLKNRKTGQKGPSDDTEMANDDQSFNIRGWLKGVNWNYDIGEAKSTGATNISNGKWFAMDLGYDWGYESANQHNGNIAGQRWLSAGDMAERSYAYSYDKVNRLMKADFTQYSGSAWSTSPATNFNIDFSVKMGDGSSVSSAYDENGNILTMSQKGLKVNASTLIDQMSYQYTGSGISNKLLSVTESGTGTTDHKLGDFTDRNTSNDDYSYDANGNLVSDKNKNIASITYNYLNLPRVITVTGKGTITYTYDAAGNKLEKLTDETGVKKTCTAYIGGYVYENNVLQYFGHESGRIRMKDEAGTVSYIYDYFLKDHLGNTRMVLTEEQQVQGYPAATLETATLTSEKLYYDIPDDAGTRVDKSTVAGYPSTGSGDQYVHKLKGDATKVGSSILLRMMAGDKVTIHANSWYKLNGANPTNTASPVSGLVTSLINNIPGVSSHTILADQLNNTEITSSLTDLMTQRDNTAYTNSKPKAYLNYILLDDHMQPVFTNDGKNSGFIQVGATEDYTNLDITNREITRTGFIYIYVSNESTDVNVYFDNLQVAHTRGPLLEETHYYPFGLTMAGISSKAAGKLENRFKFGGNELQSKEFSDGSGLELYDFHARQFDAQIGRFHSIDPMAGSREWLTPYNYVQNNPILRIDPLGTFDWIKNDKTGDYTWDNNVTSAANTPKGSKYVGANDNDIVKDLGYSTAPKTVTSSNRGYLPTDSEEGDASRHMGSYSAGQAMRVDIATTTQVSADVTTTVDKNFGMSKKFNGLREDITMKVTNSAEESLKGGISASIYGSGQPIQMGTPPASPNGDITQTGASLFKGSVSMSPGQAKQGGIFNSINISATFFKPVAEGKAFVMPSLLSNPGQLNILAPLKFSQFLPPITPNR